MKLLKAFLDISNELGPMFSQERTARRATRLLLSNLLCIGRHWLTRMLCATNRDRCDWSAAYRLFSRSPWQAQDLFEPVESLEKPKKNASAKEKAADLSFEPAEACLKAAA